MSLPSGAHVGPYEIGRPLGAGGMGEVYLARAILERLRAMPSVWIPPTAFAVIHLGLGEIDAFFDWWDKAIDARDHIIMPIKTSPFLDPIRNDPRWFALLRRMKLEA